MRPDPTDACDHAPRFRRAARDARRHELVAAVARAIARVGASGISVRAIAAEAGVSPGLIAHHFSGVEALVAAAYREVGADVAARLDAATEAAGEEPRARLAAYLAGSFVPPVMDAGLLATWLGFWALTRTMPEVAAAHAENYAGYRAAAEKLLAACGAADPRRDAIALAALVDGLWLELCLDAGVFDAEEARDIAERWLAALLPPRNVSRNAPASPPSARPDRPSA